MYQLLLWWANDGHQIIESYNGSVKHVDAILQLLHFSHYFPLIDPLCIVRLADSVQFAATPAQRSLAS